MASRRSFKLTLRLFLPTFFLLWAIIGLMMWYTISTEKDLRMELLQDRLRTVTTSVLNAYERGVNLQQQVRFIDEFFDNTTFYDLRVTVYDENDQVIAKVGNPIVVEDAAHHHVPEIESSKKYGQGSGVRISPETARESFYDAATSNDGFVTVIATVPYTKNMERAISYDSMIWIVVFALGIAASGINYVIARRSGRVISNLHNFAKAVNRGETIAIDSMKFPRGEIGDVTREIMRLYREKGKATQRMEHEHEVALRANEEKARIKRQTANNLNHELKTPVGIIKGYVDTICADPDMPQPMVRNFLLKVQEHADRLTQLLKDVSSITRLEDGSQQIETTDFDFHDLIYNIASDLEVSHMNENMEFEWDVPFDTYVRANYTLVNNAVMNLVKNAVKYSKGTVMTLKLVKQDENFCTFLFADNGTGVGEEHLPHLFDRFYRVDTGRARKRGGTGLGLPIVKSTFQALGGEITVRNAETHGLEFVFTLPKPKNIEIHQ